MKILYHHRIASKDGQYVHVSEIISALRALGHEVVVCGPRSFERQNFGGSVSFVTNLRHWLPAAIHELLEFSYCFLDFIRISQLIKKHQPDCIYERYNIFFPSGIWAKRRFSLPLILEVNSPLYSERCENQGISLHRLARWSQRYCWSRADTLLPVTQVLADRIDHELKAVGVHRSRHTTQVIANGINADDFSPDKRSPRRLKGALIKQVSSWLSQSDTTLVMGFCGFLRPWHRLDRVLDVMAEKRCPSWKLVVLGDGPARAALELRAKNLGISEQLLITGTVPREDMAALIERFDIALQPEVMDYASPLKLFEYMAMQKAIIAPNKANVTEVLSAGEDALLFEPSSDQDFSAQLLRLCQDARLREKLAINARQTLIRKDYYWLANAKKIAVLAQRLKVDSGKSQEAVN